MSDEQTVEYDLPTLLDGTVDSVIAKLPEMGWPTLQALRDLETGGKTRKTLLAAIEAQMAALAASINAESEPAAAPSEGETAPDTFADAPMPDETAPVPTDPNVNDIGELIAALTACGVVVGVDDSLPLLAAHCIRDLLTRLADGTLAMIDGAPVPASITLVIDAQANVATACSIVFGDAQGMRIDVLGQLEFGPSDFAINVGDRSRVLNKPIEFPVAAPKADVASAWLIDGDGRAASVCQLLATLPVSGGRQASIPAGFLSFAA